VAKWIGAFEDIYRAGRWIAFIAGLLGIGLFVTKGPLASSTSSTASTPPQDPTPIIAKSGDVMRSLKSVNVTLDGTMVLGDQGSVQITGTGTMSTPHEEQLALQLRFPSQVAGLEDTIVPVYIRISKGREYVASNANGPWTDVTGNAKGSPVTPSLDPIANLDFANSFRASDDLGDLLMDDVDVHHFSLNVDPTKYVQQLQADKENPLSAGELAELTNAGIQVEVWISASNYYMHEMKISMVTPSVRWDVTYRYSNWVPGGGPTSV
jgi:hypothetical protein